MAKIAFSDTKLRSLPVPASGQKSYWDDSLQCFGLRVSCGGSKTFVVNLRNSYLTVGRYGVISLSEARSEARRLLAERTLGKIRPRSISFPQAITLFLEEKAKTSRARTVSDYRRLLRKYFTFKSQLADVSFLDIERALSRIDKPSEYNHALAAAKTFFAWAVKRRLLTDNPTTGFSLHKRASRSRVLADNELKRVWVASDRCGQFGIIVKLLILTGQRRSEIAALQKDWIIEDTCTLPKETTKNGREHSFPLAQTAVSLLSKCSSQWTGSSFLFPARGSTSKPFNGWSKSKTQLDKLSGVSDWTLHDLRRTFATTMAALGTPIHITERLLNHVSGTQSGIVSVYQRHSYMAEMRAAVEKYERYLVASLAR